MKHWLLLILAASGLSLAPPAWSASFQGLGFLGGSPPVSDARGVSEDGSVVVGASTTGSTSTEAFRWTEAGGMVGLGELPGGLSVSEASAVSADGSVVVGSSDTGGLLNESFRWTAATGLVGLGHLPGGISGGATGVSADGSVVVGGDALQPFRWEANQMVGLGTLTGTGLGTATAVSADGSVIVGTSDSPNGPAEAFLWTAGGGMVGLGDLPGGMFRSTATDVSANGSVVVGVGQPADGLQEAFRWTALGGMTGLGDLGTGRKNSSASAVAGDGSMIVGSSSDGAFLWDATHGMRKLEKVLTDDFGLDLTGWTLEVARDISADGTIIVGQGVNPAGRREAWIAVLPEPHPAGLLLALAAGLAWIRRTRPGSRSARSARNTITQG